MLPPETLGRERPSLGLIEDDPVMGRSLEQRLALEGYQVDWWRSGEAALGALAQKLPDAVICDIRLPDMSGEELFQQVVRRGDVPPILFITAFGEIEQAVRLMRQGAGDYLTKPFAFDDFLQRLQHLLATRADVGGEQGLLGASPAMQRVERLLRRLAEVDTPVLLTGETGVGKEVAARLLHELARQAQGPFMAVNCAAIPHDLVESELFGHERGAFTGAHQRHEGYAARAGEGTLFLDEIGELSFDLQAKLLRLVQERSFHRVGGEQALRFRARLVAASNADLESLVAAGRFRRDLYYRINVVTLVLPPLRERPQDILDLARRFLRSLQKELTRGPFALSAATEEALLAHAWPGNVRELRNRIERAVTLAQRPHLAPADLFPELGDRAETAEAALGTLAEARDAAERRQILRALEAAEGQPARAAQLLGVARTTLWEKMRRLGLHQP